MSIRRSSLTGSVPNMVSRTSSISGSTAASSGGSSASHSMNKVLPQSLPSGGVSGGVNNNYQQQPVHSKEYMDAIHYLCDETMSKACALALSDDRDDDDYEMDGEKQQHRAVDDDEKSHLQQLEDLVQKCHDAVKIIHKEENAFAKQRQENNNKANNTNNTNKGINTKQSQILPMAPFAFSNSGGTSQQGGTVNPSSNKQSLATFANLPHHAKTHSRISRGGLLQQQNQPVGSSNKRPALDRDMSDSSIAFDTSTTGINNEDNTTTTTTTTNQNVTKKVRKGLLMKATASSSTATGGNTSVSPNTTSRRSSIKMSTSNKIGLSVKNLSNLDNDDDTSTNNTNNATPPPNALSFLAKLNKDQNSSTGKSMIPISSSKSSTVLRRDDNNNHDDQKITSSKNAHDEINSSTTETKNDNNTDESGTETLSSLKRILPPRSSRK